MTARRDGLVSYFLIGIHSDKSVFIQELNDSVPETLTFIDALAFEGICKRSGAELVGTVRTRRSEDSSIEYFHSHISDNPSDDEVECLQGALCRIAISGTGHLDPNRPYAAEALIEDGAMLDSLGITLN
jgi:hypothetical protein